MNDTPVTLRLWVSKQNLLTNKFGEYCRFEVEDCEASFETLDELYTKIQSTLNTEQWFLSPDNAGFKVYHRGISQHRKEGLFLKEVCTIGRIADRIKLL
jgi:hypothetical protein